MMTAHILYEACDIVICVAMIVCLKTAHVFAAMSLLIVTKFKCNGCRRSTEFVEIKWRNKPVGYSLYQCLDCGCVGVKNDAKQLLKRQVDNAVSRCNSCGAWQFSGLDCHTCILIGEYDAK